MHGAFDAQILEVLQWRLAEHGPQAAGRKAHLAGPIAAALMANASELRAKAPQIEQVDLLAVKLAR
jgi:hypothetical protein